MSLGSSNPLTNYIVAPPLIPGSINTDTCYARSERVASISDGFATLTGGYLHNLNDPINLQDAANKQYVLDNSASDPGISRTWKTAVRLASTTNMTLFGTQTIDGVAAVANDRVLVLNQTDSTQNGVYLVLSTQWSRTVDCPVGVQASGLGVFVLAGLQNSSKVFLCPTISSSSTAVNFGSAITFVVYGQSTAGGSNTQVQYNNAGVLAGSPNMTWNGTALVVSQAETNTIQSTLSINDVNMYTSHQASVNIGGQTNSSESLNLASYGGLVSLGALLSGAVSTLGPLLISGSNATTSSYMPSNVNISAGSVTNTGNKNGGSVSVNAGSGNNASKGGDVIIKANAGGSSGAGGSVYVYAGTGGGTSLPGSIYLTPGPGASSSQGSLYVSTSTSGQTIIQNTTNSTSTTSGSMILSGGLGVAKDIYSSNIFPTKFTGTMPLSDGKILMGNVSNLSSSVSVSGDATLADTGALTLASVVTAGTYSNVNITVDTKGRVVSATSSTFAPTNPGGTNGQLEYNNSGAFGGSSQWTYNNSTGELDGTASANFVSPASNTITSMLVTLGTASNMVTSTLSSSGITTTNLTVTSINVPTSTNTNLNTVSMTSSGLVATNLLIPYATQQAMLIGTGNTGASEQGLAVSLSSDGTILAVGGRNNAGNIGATWVFSQSGTKWTQQAKLIATGYTGIPQQGTSVSVSGDSNTLAIGGAINNGATGATWVFTRSGSNWTQQAMLIGTGNTGAAHQGQAVSLSNDGNTLAVGGFSDNGNVGATWVFLRTGSSWAQQAMLIGTGNTGASAQGISVCLSSSDGNTLAVGGSTDNSSIGATWVFLRTGTSWAQQAMLVGTGNTGGSQQGISVSLSNDGNTLAVGGSTDNTSIGATWVFTRNVTVWSQQAMLVGTGYTGFPQPQLGRSVSLSSDGNTLAVGGSGNNNGVGSTWLFTRNSTNWTQQTILTGTGTTGVNILQGISVFLNNGILAVGGSGNNTNVGATWVFNNITSGITASALSVSGNLTSTNFTTGNLASTSATAGSMTLTSMTSTNLNTTSVTSSSLSLSASLKAASITGTNMVTTTCTSTNVVATNITSSGYSSTTLISQISTLTNLVSTSSTTTSLFGPSITATNLNITSNASLQNTTISTLFGTSLLVCTPLYSASDLAVLNAGAANTLYGIANGEAGFINFSWNNGSALLSYIWISGITNVFINAVYNTATTNPIVFSVSGNNIQGQSSVQLTLSRSILRIISP